MGAWQDFQGINAGYVAELYERYRRDANSVDAATRAFFDARPFEEPPGFAQAAAAPGSAAPPDIRKIVGAANLAESVRKFGHLDAHLDPLGSAPPGDPSLKPEFHGVTEDDLRRLPAGLIVGLCDDCSGNAFEAIESLRRVYSSTSGYDFAHLRDPEARAWLQNAVESRTFRPPNDPIDEVRLLERITQEGVFEMFLHRTFPGKTRFSIEGLGILIPVLDEIIGAAAEAGIKNILLGMAHRARLNVLAHVLQKPYAQIFAEFKDPARASRFRGDVGWSGDVTYHAGARHAVKDGQALDVVVSLAPNPSHLEAVNPVVEGMARAAGTRVDHGGPTQFDPTLTLPILIHGDASFPAQGVVAETLNFNQLPGYRTGGTVHIIANNQLGFTTEPTEGRSTIYASDLARGFRIPIVRVNADDPEACLEAGRLAFAYRARFRRDFVIDLVGYRRYGHNEGDEPSFTQPLIYQKVSSHPTVRQIWAKMLIERGAIPAELPDQLVSKHVAEIEAVWRSLEPERELVEPRPAPPPPGAARLARTAVPAERLRALNEGLLRLPEGFAVHRKLERARDRRRHALDNPAARTVDWAAAEELAFASILEDGIAIRLTGQDTERGTFSQRHAVLHDVKTGARFIPLQALPQARAAFEVRNSPLSENACLGFEYGYNVQAPERLVLWEAQYGDFINSAQVVVDEFIVSARSKWGLTPSLVLLLPHGWEGQGPDHSSGRAERFLELAAAGNLRLANCTTAAQYFHLLRRQAALLKTDPLPLIVLTPKSLLRHPAVASSLEELAEGRWQSVIDDPEAGNRAGEVKRAVLCSGKIYLDLVTSAHRKKAVALCRVEQLYPFPAADVLAILERYPHLEEVVWVQEEPRNMGAWEFVRRELEPLLDGRRPLGCVSRPASPSPAEGSSAWHAATQQTLIRQAFHLAETRMEEGELVKRT